MKKKITDDGYRWRYHVERKKNRLLELEVKALNETLERVHMAHAKASDAWAMAEARIEELDQRLTDRQSELGFRRREITESKPVKTP